MRALLDAVLLALAWIVAFGVVIVVASVVVGVLAAVVLGIIDGFNKDGAGRDR